MCGTSACVALRAASCRGRSLLAARSKGDQGRPRRQVRRGTGAGIACASSASSPARWAGRDRVRRYRPAMSGATTHTGPGRAREHAVAAGPGSTQSARRGSRWKRLPATGRFLNGPGWWNMPWCTPLPRRARPSRWCLACVGSGTLRAAMRASPIHGACADDPQQLPALVVDPPHPRAFGRMIILVARRLPAQ